MNYIYLKRMLFLIVGSIILGIGIGLAVLSGHGGEAVSVFSEGLSKSLQITIGTASICFYIIFAIPMLRITKKQFGIGTILSPCISAITLDLFLMYVSFEMSSLGTIVCMFIGIILISVGIAMYISSELGSSSYDAMILTITKKVKKPLWIIKSTGDLLLCIVGYTLGGTLGLGPICAVLFIGTILDVILKLINRWGILS